MGSAASVDQKKQQQYSAVEESDNSSASDAAVVAASAAGVVATQVTSAVDTLKTELLAAIAESRIADSSHTQTKGDSAGAQHGFYAPPRGISRYGSLDLRAPPIDERKSSIIGTLGDRIKDHRDLAEIVDSGINVARINMSHASKLWAEQVASLLIEYRHQNPGRICGLAVDLKCPVEARLGCLGQFSDSVLRQNSTVVLTTSKSVCSNGSAEKIFVQLPSTSEEPAMPIVDFLRPGSVLVVKDSAPSTSFIKLVVLEGNDDPESEQIKCTVAQGGRLASRARLFLPANCKAPAKEEWSEEALQDVSWAVDVGADFIFAGGLRSANDVKTLRKRIAGGSAADESEDAASDPKHQTKKSGQDIQLVARIESLDAMDALDDILLEADGVVFCAGELEADILCNASDHGPGFQSAACKVAMAQKLVIAKGNMCGKPVVLGSALLPTYSTRGRPEATNPTPVSDGGAVWAVEAAARGPSQMEQAGVLNAVLDGVDSFMLTAETTTGLRPPLAVHWLHGCLTEAEAVFDHWEFYKMIHASTAQPLSPNETVASAAVATAHEQNAALIVVVTHTGVAARYVAKYRPKVPVLLVCESHRICRQAYLSRGLIPMIGRLSGQNVDTTLSNAVGLAETVDYCRKGQLVVAVYEVTEGSLAGCGANMRVIQVE